MILLVYHSRRSRKGWRQKNATTGKNSESAVSTPSRLERSVQQSQPMHPGFHVRLKRLMIRGVNPPVLYLFGGCNGAGKTTFARAFLSNLEGPPRFLNADEIARGLSPLDPSSVALRAGKLLLSEINGCLEARRSFGLESTLSGMTQVAILKRAQHLGYYVQIHFLWLPSASLSIRRVAQRVRKGGHFIPASDILRRHVRSLENFINHYGPLADVWFFWDNRSRPPVLRFHSDRNSLQQLRNSLP